jgi:hypothetical protein
MRRCVNSEGQAANDLNALRAKGGSEIPGRTFTVFGSFAGADYGDGAAFAGQDP